MRVLSNEYVSAFCLEFSLLLHSGIGVEDGLYLLAEDEDNKQNKKMYKAMAEELADGKTFSQVIEKTGVFPKYVSDMIATGENTGRLEQSFKSLASYYDRQVQINSQIKSALLYPLILMLLMFVIIIVLLVKVLPIFDQVYSQLGGSMTGAAKVLLDIGQYIKQLLPVILVIVGIVATLVAIIALTQSTRLFVLKLYKKWFGNHGITKKISDSRFASSMAMGMQSGLNTEEAFRNAMNFHGGSKAVKKRYENCLNMLESGEPLAKCFKDNHIFETSFCRILDLGAKSGTADDAMEEIARRLDDKVQREIEKKVGRIEPTIVIVTSVLVGIILVAVMLPLINIMSSIG